MPAVKLLKLLASAAEVQMIASLLLPKSIRAPRNAVPTTPRAPLRRDTGQPTAQPWEEMNERQFLSAEGPPCNAAKRATHNISSIAI